jgi:hypothetical protein
MNPGKRQVQPVVLEGRTVRLIVLALLVSGTLLRLVPHPANFAPVTAIAIFGGATLPRRWAIVLPLGLMVVSDAFLGWYSLIPVTWGWYLLTALASSYWLKHLGWRRGGLLTAGASAGFFVVTNFAVWLTSGMYVHTWAGLGRCYLMALPFFRNSLLSDGLYTAALFMAYHWGVRADRKRQQGAQAAHYA